MTTSRPSEPPQDLTDEELDAMLADTSEQLLTYIRDHDDPNATLSRMMGGIPGPPSPAEPRMSPAERIRLRQAARRLFGLLQDGVVASMRIRKGIVVCQKDLSSLLRSGGARSTLSSLLGEAEALADFASVAHRLSRYRESPLNVILARSVCQLATSLVEELAAAKSVVDRASLSVLPRAVRIARPLLKAEELISEVASNFGRLAHNIELLATERIDASGADLSHLDMEIDALIGVVWDDQTRWAPDLQEEVRANSEEIAPGVYRVSPPRTKRGLQVH